MLSTEKRKFDGTYSRAYFNRFQHKPCAYPPAIISMKITKVFVAISGTEKRERGGNVIIRYSLKKNHVGPKSVG